LSLILRSWRWCLRCCSVVVSSNGMHKVEQNCTKKKPHKCPKFKCNTVSVSFSACKCSSVVFSSKVGREKKKSLETVLWMAICGCGLPACCSQPAVAGGVIYANLRSKLNTHLALQALFTQSSPVPEPLLQAFPFPSTLGKVTLHQLSQASVYIYSSRGKWVFPLLLWSFPPSAAFTGFPTPGCWVCAAAPAFSGPACLFTVPWGIPLPLSLVLRAPHPLCYVSFFFFFFSLLLLIIQFLFFSLGGCWSVQEAMLIWPRVVCGNTVYSLAHLVVCVFPSCLGAGIWWMPSWFLTVKWSGDALCRLEVWRSQCFASSQWFFM
jgi:hypothetical protein